MNATITMPLLESILSNYQSILGRHFAVYRNRCYRLVNYCLLFNLSLNKQQVDELCIAAAFHHLKLDPFFKQKNTIRLALSYAAANHIQVDTQRLKLMLLQYQSLLPLKSAHPLIEGFRRASWIDFSQGLIHFGLPHQFIRRIRKDFPTFQTPTAARQTTLSTPRFDSLVLKHANS